MQRVGCARIYHRGCIGEGVVVEPRDVETIDRELELVTAVAAAIRRLGGSPTNALIDDLLDERIATNRKICE